MNDFINLVISVWQNGLYGIDVGRLVIAVGIFLAFALLRGILTHFIIGRISALAARTKNDIDDALIDALRPPLRFIPIVMGVFFAVSSLGLDGKEAEFAATLYRSLIVFTLFWALYATSGPISAMLQRADKILTDPMIEWLRKAIRLAFLLLGGATILELWGIEVAPLIAGLGLFGVAVALGAQDLFKNLIAGLFVIGERRFHPGDWISVEGLVEGTVEQIGFRTTTIRRFDKAPVYVPNAELSDRPVINYSRMNYRRIKWLIGLRYDTKADQLMAIRARIEAYIRTNDDFAIPDETTSFIHLDGFGASSIDMQLYCFTRSTDWLEWLKIKEALLLQIKEIVADENSDFAYPSQSLYLENRFSQDAQPTETLNSPQK